MSLGRYGEAGEHFGQSLVDFDRLDDPQYRAMTTSSLGWVAFLRGDIPLATRYAIDGLLETHRMRDVGTTTISLHIGVLLAMMLGRWEEGAAVHGAYEAPASGERAAAGRAGAVLRHAGPIRGHEGGARRCRLRGRLRTRPWRLTLDEAVALRSSLARRSPDQPADRTCRIASAAYRAGMSKDDGDDRGTNRTRPGRSWERWQCPCG